MQRIKAFSDVRVKILWCTNSAFNRNEKSHGQNTSLLCDDFAVTYVKAPQTRVSSQVLDP